MFSLQLWYQYYSQTSIIWTPKDRTTSQRCQYYNRTSLIQIPSVHMTEESFLQSNLLIQTPDSSVCVTEVSVLQSNLLNIDTWQNQVSTSQRRLYYNWTSWYRHQRDRTKSPHYRGVCITIEPPDTDTNETELSVHITEESVLQLDLLIQTPKGQNQVSTSQRCLYYNRTSWYRHQWDRAKCSHHRGVCFTVGPPNTDTKGQNQVSTSQRCLH